MTGRLLSEKDSDIDEVSYLASPERLPAPLIPLPARAPHRSTDRHAA